MEEKYKEVKTILCVRNDRFGEFLLNIPALRALKETFINARIIAVVDPYLADLTKSIQLIDETIEWGQGEHLFREKLKLISLLRGKSIDIAVMLNPSKDFNIFTFLAGIPVRIGYDRKYGFLLTRKLADLKYLGNRHEVEYNLELVGLLGAKTGNPALSLTLENNTLDPMLRNYGITDSDTLVALHPWTSDPIKQWPLDNFRAVANELLRYPNIKVILIGGKDESGKSSVFYENILRQGNLIDLSGKTSLRELAVLLKKCKLVISGDSGPVHLAASAGGRALVIFRNDISGKGPKRWGPWGPGHVVIEKASLVEITPEEVLAKAKEMLGI